MIKRLICLICNTKPYGSRRPKPKEFGTLGHLSGHMQRHYNKGEDIQVIVCRA